MKIMGKTIVIYHKADFDGIFCREIAKTHFGDTAENIGWDYGDGLIRIETDVEHIFMLDISVEQWMDDPRLVWIDHHKSAIDKYDRTTGSSEGDVATKIKGVRIDGVAACRLAWQFWFSVDKHIGREFTKEDYVNRITTEPLAVRLAGEYDIWDKRDPRAELFQHGLRSQDLTECWPLLLSLLHKDEDLVDGLLKKGEAIQFVKRNENAGIVKAFAFTIQFEGFCLLACNAARYNSQLFESELKPEHDGCLGFNWDGKLKQWRVSLYSDKAGIDLSPVAVKYGGGGHRGACGFRTDKLPFLK